MGHPPPAALATPVFPTLTRDTSRSAPSAAAPLRLATCRYASLMVMDPTGANPVTLLLLVTIGLSLGLVLFGTQLFGLG